jgi:hypothetical protein
MKLTCHPQVPFGTLRVNISAVFLKQFNPHYHPTSYRDNQISEFGKAKHMPHGVLIKSHEFSKCYIHMPTELSKQKTGKDT